ncbi:hypothetical protein F7725_018398, partial [Dissostichus mawsoni]
MKRDRRMSRDIRHVSIISHRDCIGMMEDFSGLALPPLFGGHILEAELEPGGVELGPGEVELGPGGSESEDSWSPSSSTKNNTTLEEGETVRNLFTVNHFLRLPPMVRLKIMFLMKTLDAHGDDYRNAQLNILLEDEPGVNLDPAAGVKDDRPNGVSGPSSSAALPHAALPKRKRHRIPRQEKDKDQQ